MVPPSLAGTGDKPGRSQLSRCMELRPPWRAPFREIFLLGKTLGCMQDLIGNGFRGTEGRILMQQHGGEGHALHGGGTTRDLGEADSTLTLGGNMSLYQNGQLWNSTMSVQYALCDIGAGDGGFCAIPGSHKSNYECPMQLRDCAIDMPGLIQPVMRAGDMLLFTEALTHGTLPWAAEHERRTLFFRYVTAGKGGIEIPKPGADREAFVNHEDA